MTVAQRGIALQRSDIFAIIHTQKKISNIMFAYKTSVVESDTCIEPIYEIMCVMYNFNS